MIAISDLQKVVAQRTVLDVPQLSVGAGQIAAVVGPADSGIDPLSDLLIGRERPTAGTLTIAGRPPAADPLYFSRQAGVLFADDALYENRTPRGNLAFYARLRGLPQQRVDEILEAVGLVDHAGAGLAGLPSGLRRRLALGVALLHHPSLLLCHRPFSRCDEASMSLITQVIRRQAAEGGTVLILADGEANLAELCDVIYFLEQGRIARVRRPAEEQAAARPFKIPVKLEGRVALVNPADILYAAAEDGRTFLFTQDDPLPTQFTLAELEERLGRSGFFRAHRGYLVNLQHIIEVIPYTRSSFSLRLDDPAGTLVPLSKDAAQELRDLFDY